MGPAGTVLPSRIVGAGRPQWKSAYPQVNLLRHAIEAGWPRRGTRLSAEHESAATPEAAGAQRQTQYFTCRTAQREGCRWCISMRSDGRQWCWPDRLFDGDIAMKIVVSALIALSVLASIAGPASVSNGSELLTRIGVEELTTL